MTDTQKMLDEHVRDIAERLNELSESYFYWNIDTEEPNEDSDSNYFDDIYGLTCYLDVFDKTIDGYRAMIAFGGPNIYVDTKTMRVEGLWGCDKSYYPITYDTAKNIDILFAEWYPINE